MDTLQRKTAAKYRQTNANKPSSSHQQSSYQRLQYKNRLQSFPPPHYNNKCRCDWLLCLIFCLGFIVAMLIALVMFALFQHDSIMENKTAITNNHNIENPKTNTKKSNTKNNKVNAKKVNEEIFGSSVIDHSREFDFSQLDPNDMPHDLPPIQSQQLEQDPVYQTMLKNIDIMKLPHNCSLIDELYQCEGQFFTNFTHYHDDWSNQTQTQWYIPTDIGQAFAGTEGQFAKWKYDIIDFPIIPNFLTSKKSRDNISITIVTQTSMDRLNLIEMIASNWDGIISVAIYIRLEESLLHAEQLIIEFFQRVELKYPALLDVSILFETDYLYKNTPGIGYYSVMYPVNHLRNLALQAAKTEFVLLTDGDFMPNKGFHDKAAQQYKYAQSIQIGGNHSRPIALIIPAFEFGSMYRHYTKKQKQRKRKIIRKQEEDANANYVNLTLDQLPLTKEQIHRLYEEDKVRGFHMHRCAACHKPTNFTRWMTASKPYNIRYKASYEPYIMTKRVGMHRYDARFRGYGWNKIVHLLTLAWIDKAYWTVASDLFIFHLPHYSSRDANNYFKGKNSARWNWIVGLSKLALRDLKKKKDQTGYIVS